MILNIFIILFQFLFFDIQIGCQELIEELKNLDSDCQKLEFVSKHNFPNCFSDFYTRLEKISGHSPRISYGHFEANYISDSFRRADLILWRKSLKCTCVFEFEKKDSFNSINEPDTLSLFTFWDKFKSDLRNENKEKIIENFSYPIHLAHLINFQLALDCDTTQFISNEEVYANLSLENKKDFIKYYNVVFSPEMKKIILATDNSSLFKKDMKFNKSNKLIYRFFARDYGFQSSCNRDINLRYYFFQEENLWKIKIY